VGAAVRRFWWLGLGVVAIIAGLSVAVASHTWGESSFGWFAYSPLSEDGPTISEQLSRRTDQFWIGVVVIVVGLVLIAAGLGYRRGLRAGLARHDGPDG
jgi:hypothetical protein